jgi:CAAX prenyl protease-like protein
MNRANGVPITIRRSEAFPRISPFLIFMAFIGLQEILGTFCRESSWYSAVYLPHWLYVIRALAAGTALLFFRSSYSELDIRDAAKASQTLLSIGVGIAVFFLWIHMDFSLSILGARPSLDPSLIENPGVQWSFITVRLLGAVAIVPIMEELFWRSWLMRKIISDDFEQAALGEFSWQSFVISNILFGLEHYLVFAGIMAGIAYSLLLYRTKSITQCVIAHATTNLALGIYVLITGQWLFW